jgi:protein-disulfide isomerase
MVECEFCGEEFEGDEDLHIHWMEEHEDDMNSHQKDKAKKAKREREEREKVRKEQRKRYLYQGVGVAVLLAIVAVVGPQLIPSGGGAELDLEGEPMIGNASANVTVVEFGDYQCPYCKQFDQQVFPQLEENYIDTGQVKFYYVNYAFLGDDSTEAAVASECVYNQANTTQFWDFHHAVFDNQGREHSGWVTTDSIMEIARDSTEGLDYDGLRSCISGSSTSSEVQSDKRMGQANGVTGTPSIFVNGEQLRGFGYETVSQAIDQELQN